MAPLLIADVPPILDYPNHLARLVLLAAGPDDPVLGRIATPHWAVIPDLAVDVLGPPLLRVLPVHVAGRLLLGGILLLNLAGGLALHRVWFGRARWWPLASGLAAYNEGFLLGFLNWQIGCGLAMLAGAGWAACRARRPVATLAGGVLASAALFFCHPMALAFFLALAAGTELAGAASWREWPRRAAGLLPLLAVPLCLAGRSELAGAAAAAHWMTPWLKLGQAAAPFVNYVPWLDYGSAALVYGGIGLGLWRGWCRLAPPARPVLAGLALLYWPLPFDLMSGSFLDTRVALMAGFLTFAATDWTGAPRPAGRAVAVAAVALLAVRMGVLASVWWGQRQDLSDLRAVIAPVPPGARVLLRTVPRAEAPAYWAEGPRHRWLTIGLRTEYHLPALLLIESGAWWQELFANPAQQPIMLRPDYQALWHLGRTLPPHAALTPAPAGLARFDYLLLLEADAAPANPAPDCLEPVARAGFAALYCTRDAAPCRGAAERPRP